MVLNYFLIVKSVSQFSVSFHQFSPFTILSLNVLKKELPYQGFTFSYPMIILLIVISNKIHFRKALL